jgi:hypothetical protein
MRLEKGVTFDAGGLIALDRADRRVVTTLTEVLQKGWRVTIPATALAQAVRNPARQARISRLIRHPYAKVIALDETDAIEVGLLLARTGTSDIADAHVAVCARRSGQAVVTSDPDDMSRIAPELSLFRV